jgi:uncharacterized BrkB/YihY/UPF0761 family membrane protein
MSAKDDQTSLVDRAGDEPGGDEPRPEPTPAERVRAWSEERLEWAREEVQGVDAVVEAIERERRAGGGLLAGGVAYKIFFWLVPLGLVLAAIVSFWSREDPDGLEDAARSAGLGAVAARSASRAIEEGAHSRWYLLIVGLGFVVWFSMGVVRALVVASAVAWGQRPEKVRRPLAAGLAFSGIALGVSVATGVVDLLRKELGVPGLIMTLAIVLLYAAVALWVMSVLPHGDAPWRALVPGVVLVAVGVQVLHLVVVLYLAPRLGRSSSLYGPLGAATVILLWLFLTARLITGAAFLNATLWERRNRGG